MKKIAFLLLSMFTAGLISIATPQASYATDDTTYNCRYLLGMPSWDCDVNLEVEKTQDVLKVDVARIVLNISSAISVLGTYIALGFVIFGGYKYMFSYGDPGKVAQGKKTLTQAFIGLAIVMLANVIFTTFRIVLFNNKEMSSMTSAEEVSSMIGRIIQWVIGVGGVVAAVFLVYGGVSYMTAGGEPGKLAKAKNSITYALIGLAIVGLSEIILAFVIKTINDAGGESALLIENIIALKGE